MRHGGFEPPTPWLKVKCSTDWANIPYYLHNKCPEPESNQWHEDFQSSALPTELSGHLMHIFTVQIAGAGFEPTTFGLWARRASRLLHPAILNYLPFQVKPMIGLEPITCWLQISCSANWATSAKTFSEQLICNQHSACDWHSSILKNWATSARL